MLSRVVIACALGSLTSCGRSQFDETPDGSIGVWTISVREEIDTDLDARCAPGALCTIRARRLTVEVGGTLRAIGSRPLQIISDEAVAVGGTIDVSSEGLVRGAGGFEQCDPLAPPASDPGGAGGGAGGSFGAVGGRGGVGNIDGATALGARPAAALAPSTLRGGCPGSTGGTDMVVAGGLGGVPGGAVHVRAPSITVEGVIAANGTGGTGAPGNTGGGAGGGGGGSGGMIVLEATTLSIGAAATLAANGGGGGEGCAQPRGADGSAGKVGSTGAPGGAVVADGGDGGTGGALVAIGGDGQPARGGGGGGGGSAGIIRLVGTATVGGTISPPAQ